MKHLILLGTLALMVLSARSVAAQDRSRSPHGTLQLECATCHRSEGWTPVRISRSFDHNKLGFPLTGAHGSTTCRSCHQSLDFKGTSNSCAACHTDTHRGELGADCARCHTPRSFLDRSVMSRAHQLTRFPLEGAHLTADCTACHLPAAQGRQQFVARQTTCVSCHEGDYARAKDPDHGAGGFPRDCAQCHTVALWTRARFNHDASRFPLTGAHRAVQCIQCHVGNRFSGLRSDCLSCHQQDYNQAAQPNHVQAGLPTDCVACHATSSWTAAYDHSQTQFPLTGAHRATSCLQCHGDGVYRGKPTACVSCHQADFNGATTPNHVQAQLPTDCTPCHTTMAWTPATFDHNATQFPLTGAHLVATCDQCHADGVYRGKPTACGSCHQTDYNQTTDPNHAAAGFSTDCASCHTTIRWDGAKFDHDAVFFPIYSGSHQGRWSSCSDCHQNATSFAQFTCLTCHEHNKADMDAKHSAQAGYVYASTECLRCHPRGTH